MGKWSYGVILDAGSSGTRLHIYKWLKPDKARLGAGSSPIGSLPEIKSVYVKKIHPGVSTFGNTPELVGPDHLARLFKHATNHIPKNEVKNTPLFFLATAGMRLLPAYQRQDLLDRICSYTSSTTAFQLPDCGLHVQVIAGETEGLYGWVAVNYLLGGFDDPQAHNHGKGHHTYGFLDMGGASAQIAFAPNQTESQKHSDLLTLVRLRTINGKSLEYRVFLTTWLGFGVNEARSRYLSALAAAIPGASELPDPCLPRGLNMDVNISHQGHPNVASIAHLSGTGQLLECKSQVYPLLGKDVPCQVKPCSMKGVHLPAIDYDINHFIGISEYWHTTHELLDKAMGNTPYSFKTFLEKMNTFCALDWETIEEGVKAGRWKSSIKVQGAKALCFKAAWLTSVLHDGVGVPEERLQIVPDRLNHTASNNPYKDTRFLDPFQAVNDIDGVELSWTLGKMLLYATSQIPPGEGALAVGFGSNTLGIPADFQYASAKDPQALPKEDQDWRDTFTRESPRRIPGIIIFVVILIVVILMLCGRERRKSIRHRIRSIFGNKGHHNSAWRKVLNRTFRNGDSPTYERVLEDGDLPNEFELSQVELDDDHSDSDQGNSLGRTSGWATPQLKTGFDSTLSVHHNNLSQGNALNLVLSTGGTNAMGRSGLMSRTDSRERLAVGPSYRLGTASPTRMRTPMMVSPLKESVD